VNFFKRSEPELKILGGQYNALSNNLPNHTILSSCKNQNKINNNDNNNENLETENTSKLKQQGQWKTTAAAAAGG
jgi:hypothetical protein